MIRESCSCGASIEIYSHDWRALGDWRESHKHDDRIVTLDVHDDPCDCDVCKTAWVKELKRRIVNLEGSGYSGTPPSSENPDGSYSYRMKMAESGVGQNSTENGTVVTANADNPNVDGERRQDEPPAGTPVWHSGRWWTRPVGADRYIDCMTEAVVLRWSDMPGAVAALTPAEVNSKRRESWMAGREAAAESVEQVMATSFALKGGRSMDVISREAAVRAARGGKT